MFGIRLISFLYKISKLKLNLNLINKNYISALLETNMMRYFAREEVPRFQGTNNNLSVPTTKTILPFLNW